MRRFPDVETVKDSIIVEMMLHCILQWLGGGSYLYIRLSAGIGEPAFYSYIYKCINAILDSVDLPHMFPDTANDWMKLLRVLSH